MSRFRGFSVVAVLLAFGLVVAVWLTFRQAVPVGGAQRYPSRSISLIVPWAPGGGADTTARTIAPALERILGVPIEVVNRTGGSGAVGHGAIAQARPDGYTIGIITTEVVLPPWVDQTKIDAQAFTPISLLINQPAAIVVRKDAVWKTIQDLIADIKQNPGKYKASGTAKWGSWDFARIGFLKNIGVEESALPWVPSQGSANALQELVAGGVDVVFVSIPEATALAKAGEIRFLAVMTEERHPSFPDVPTLKEQGIDWIFSSFLMVAAPKSTPPDIVKQLEEAFAKAVEDPEFVKSMNNANYVISYLDSAQSNTFLEERAKAMNELVQSMELKW